ncbi:MAG: TolC family protein [Verrucomicrobiota bacterium]
MSHSPRLRLRGGVFIIGLFLGWMLPLVVVGQETDTATTENTPAETRTLGIVRDGDSWYFDMFVEAMEKELLALAKGNYSLVVDDQFHGGDDPQKIGAELKRAIDNLQVDAIYAAGVVATERAARMPDAERTKPVVGGALQFSNEREKINDLGRSTAPNFSFTTAPQRVTADLALAKRLSGSRSVHVIIDQIMRGEMPHIDEAKARIEEELDSVSTFVWTGPTASDALSKIPASAEIAYVTILPRMPDVEREKLYTGLAERGIPTISMYGVPEVRNVGAMASLNPDNLNAIARRAALNLHQLFTGSKTQDLPVLLPVQDQLVINETTAEKTGWSPTYDVSLEADFVNETRAGFKDITLEKAMSLAAEQNIDILIAREDEAIARGDVAIGRSFLLPQVSVAASHARIDRSDRIDPSMTPDYNHQGSYGLELRQILFNDEAIASFRAQKRNLTSIQLDTFSIQFDAIEIAALAYFDLLTAEALYAIEKENLRLTEDNLQLARLRQNIGAADRTEVFRWEQDRARSKSSLIQRDFNRRDAMVALNVALGVPRETMWTSDEWVNPDFDPAEESGPNSKPYRTLGPEESAFLDESMNNLIKRKSDFENFGAFVQFLAVDNSPELLSFDELLAAQGIILEQRQRSFFLPEISGSLDADRVVSGSEFASTDGENEITAGVQLSFPLFEGGKRKAEVEQQGANIRKLAAQRESAVQQIEQRALAAVHGIGATHPNILLSNEALVAARKNFSSVQDKYQIGAASILDLLDAQSSLLAQAQEDAIASFSYMQQVNSLQRSIAWFEFQKSAEEKAQMEQMLRVFLEGGTITTRNGTFPPAAQKKPEQPAPTPAKPSSPPETSAEETPLSDQPEPGPVRKRLRQLFQKKK